MDLNNENFRSILANIYEIDQKYIVLKQGNWYNPDATSARPKTWIGYKILRNSPITLPFWREDSILEEETEVFYNYLMAPKKAEIDLQFIGERSEELANSVFSWLNRQDVIAELEKVNGKIMANDLSSWSSDYVLDGENTITAWNVKIYIVWVQKIQTEQIKFTDVTIEGGSNG
jgi:hypothetical protein